MGPRPMWPKRFFGLILPPQRPGRAVAAARDASGRNMDLFDPARTAGSVRSTPPRLRAIRDASLVFQPPDFGSEISRISISAACKERVILYVEINQIPIEANINHAPM